MKGFEEWLVNGGPARLRARLQSIQHGHESLYPGELVHLLEVAEMAVGLRTQLACSSHEADTFKECTIKLGAQLIIERAKLEESEAAKSQLAVRLLAVDGQATELESQLATERTARERAEAACAAMSQLLSRLRSCVVFSEARTEIDKVMAGPNGQPLLDELAALRIENQQLQGACDGFRQACDSLRTRVAELESERSTGMAGAIRERDEAQAQVADSAATIDNPLLDLLRSRLTESRRDVKVLGALADDILDELATLRTENEKLTKERDEARTKLAEREEELRKYGAHTQDCMMRFPAILDGRECDCGFSAVEAGLPGKGERK